MAIPRKLQESDERQIALTHFCGVNAEVLAADYNVSVPTVLTSIIHDRSHQWNDPLVEFYRQAPGRGRDENAAHFYLACHDVKVNLGDMIKKCPSVYEKIYAHIYAPSLERVATETSLESYLRPDSSLERMLKEVFGTRSKEKIIEPFLLRHLQQAYAAQQGKYTLSLEDVFAEVAAEVRQKIKYGGLAITPIKISLIEDVLKTLTEREQKTISLHYGLEGGSEKTFKDTGLALGISPERSRQILAKAYRKLRHSSRADGLKYVYGLVTDADVATYCAEREEAKRYQHYKEIFTPIIRQEVLQEVAQNHSLIENLNREGDPSLMSKPVDKLELSVRSANILQTYATLKGIKILTVRDLTQMTDNDILHTKNAGRKSLREIKEILEEMGLSLIKE